MNDTQITEDQWEKQYKPIANHLDPDASWNGTMFETYDTEFDFVHEQPENNVWTWVDGDEGTLIVAGKAFVNRIGYFVTSEPWTDYVEVAIDTYISYEGEEVKELKQRLQDNLLAYLEGMPADVLDTVCQIVIDTVNGND